LRNEKLRVQAVQKDLRGETREIDEQRRTYVVSWSETIERNKPMRLFQQPLTSACVQQIKELSQGARSMNYCGWFNRRLDPIIGMRLESESNRCEMELRVGCQITSKRHTAIEHCKAQPSE
jgi:hypothetical protein